MLKELISISVESLSKFYKISSIIDHNGEKGGFREYFISQLLRPILPLHFGISSGIIIDHTGKQSSQLDIIIFDTRLMAPIWETYNRGIYPVDSVLAVIEVKSKFKSSYCSDVISAARKIGPKDRTDGIPNELGLHIITLGTTKDLTVTYPLYIIFAYGSDAEKDEFERLKEHDSNALYYISGLTILNKGVWAVIGKEKRSLSVDMVQNAIDFTLLLIDGLEDLSKQRGTLRLQNWLELSPTLMQ